MQHKQLEALIDQMVEVIQSDRNRANGKLWKPMAAWSRDCWRGIAIKNEEGKVPFTVDPEKQLWARVTGFDVSRYFSDADVHLEGQLKMNLHKFNQFKDNTYFTGDISPWFGVITELTMFGPEVVWREDRDPWIAGEPVLENPDKLEQLEMPDFFKSGLMPKVHEFYERIGEQVDGKLNVVFPDWVRGPFCIAAHLRGMQTLLMDMLLNPQWVHKLMRFITDARKEWSTERAKFTGKPLHKGKLYNDEVDSPSISPTLYREFILPYEQELSDFYGGMVYFHSCGNITPFLEDIEKIGRLDMVHVGPWTNIAEAVSKLSPEIALDICLDPAGDIMQASEEEIRAKLTNTIETCRGKVAFSIRADAFEIINSAQADHEKVLQWCKIARELTGQA